MKIRFFLLIAIWVICLTGCVSVEVEKEAPEVVEGEPFPVAFELPATFAGTLGCENCSRVDVYLHLRKDNLYQLRRSYYTEQGLRNVVSEMNSWKYLLDEDVIILDNQKGEMKSLGLIGPESLKIIEPLTPQNSFKDHGELKRVVPERPFDDVVQMRGMFSINEGNAELQECASGNVYSVSPYGDFSRIARRYRSIPHGRGAPMLLESYGTIGRTDYSEEGEEAITITSFTRFDMSKDCLGNSIRAALTGTLWRLEELGGRGIDTFSMASVPYLMMEDDSTIMGFGGCNMVNGRYQVLGQRMQIVRTREVRLGCFSGLELENLFYQMLDSVETFEIEGETLRVMNKNGDINAVFTTGS